jgi:outer membrane protein assembly factor BamD (BamD/ComL family)
MLLLDTHRQHRRLESQPASTAEAKDEMNSGSFDKAVDLLEKLEGRAAGTLLAQQAQLEKGLLLLPVR